MLLGLVFGVCEMDGFAHGVLQEASADVGESAEPALIIDLVNELHNYSYCT